MTDERYSGARWKLKRAKSHIHDLNIVLDELEVGNTYRVVVELNADGTGYDLVMRGNLPPEINLITGDAIHNLRSALDFIACALVLREDPTHDLERVFFPISRNRKALETTLKNEPIKVAGVGVALLLLDGVHSYYGGNESLWAIHRLDIADKHRLLIPADAATVQIPGKDGVFRFRSCKDGEVVGSFPLDEPDMHAGDEQKVMPLIRFGEIDPVKGKMASAILSRMESEVTRVLDWFSSAFP